jgi:hypothetical protein
MMPPHPSLLYKTHIKATHPERMHTTLFSTTNVVALYAAVALLALSDAVLYPHAYGSVYVATQIFLFFATLLLLLHVIARHAESRPDSTLYNAIPTKNTQADKPDTQHTHDTTTCCVKKQAHVHTELVHIFLHLLCFAYVRIACWFEWRTLIAFLG